MSVIGATVMPGDVMSTISSDSPSWAGASGSVRQLRYVQPPAAATELARDLGVVADDPRVLAHIAAGGDLGGERLGLGAQGAQVGRPVEVHALSLPAMRAIVLESYGGPEVLQLREVPDPEPG